MHIFEKFREKARTDAENTDDDTEVQSKRVAIINGLAEVQDLDQPEWMKKCRDLANHFSERLFNKYNGSHEIRLIFESYVVPSSLKSAIRRWLQGCEFLFIIE